MEAWSPEGTKKWLKVQYINYPDVYLLMPNGGYLTDFLKHQIFSLIETLRSLGQPFPEEALTCIGEDGKLKRLRLGLYIHSKYGWDARILFSGWSSVVKHLEISAPCARDAIKLIPHERVSSFIQQIFAESHVPFAVLAPTIWKWTEYISILWISSCNHVNYITLLYTLLPPSLPLKPPLRMRSASLRLLGTSQRSPALAAEEMEQRHERPAP